MMMTVMMIMMTVMVMVMVMMVMMMMMMIMMIMRIMMITMMMAMASTTTMFLSSFWLRILECLEKIVRQLQSGSQMLDANASQQSLGENV
eukprot:7313290-Karenia_brevis.AAC.1